MDTKGTPITGQTFRWPLALSIMKRLGGPAPPERLREAALKTLRDHTDECWANCESVLFVQFFPTPVCIDFEPGVEMTAYSRVHSPPVPFHYSPPSY